MKDRYYYSFYPTEQCHPDERITVYIFRAENPMTAEIHFRQNFNLKKELRPIHHKKTLKGDLTTYRIVGKFRNNMNYVVRLIEKC